VLLASAHGQGVATLVEFVVADGCGSWPAFVGGGSTAY
jgi:hypothetical protein